jgi:predicted nuclease with TOPRIM domain
VEENEHLKKEFAYLHGKLKEVQEQRAKLDAEKASFSAELLNFAREKKCMQRCL